jgi:parallel beta-helix repeat protein
LFKRLFILIASLAVSIIAVSVSMTDTNVQALGSAKMVISPVETVSDINYAFLGTEFTIIRVPCDYSTIQEAIDAAAPESIILVGNGTYTEHLVVDKPLKLLGEDKATTILEGDGSGTIIMVTADNVCINGFTIRNGVEGILLSHSRNATVSGNIVTLHATGVILVNSSGISILENLITQCGTGDSLFGGDGLELWRSNNNSIYNNIIAKNLRGLYIDECDCDLIYKNAISDNHYYGISLIDSNNNEILQNDFINNNQNVDMHDSYGNIFDDSIEGNYWDSYCGLNDGSGGRVAGDGIGDTDLPYLGMDYHPLICPHGPIPIFWEDKTYLVGLHSNSTVSTLRFTQANKKVTFTINGPTTTAGYCSVVIPKNLLRGSPWTILLNDINITSQAITMENETHTTIHFTYNHNTHSVQIIGTWVVPEFSATMILPTLMTLTTLVLVIKKLQKPKHF